MALYEGLKQARSGEAAVVRPRPAAAEFTTLRSHVRDASRSAPFLDRFLGAGSGRTLAKAGDDLLGGARRGRPPAPVEAPRATGKTGGFTAARMQVVGAGGEAPLPHGRRGLGRAFLVVLALAGTAAVLRPWQRVGILKTDWGALFRLPSAFDGSDPHAGQAALSQEKRQAAEDAAKLAALPFQAATGRALGLWRDSSGRWWRVDGGGALAPCPDPTAAENLGLPEIQGAAAIAQAYHGGRRLLLDLPPGRLAELLPLRASVASEVRALEVQDPSQPMLLTLDGTRCLMGDGDWGALQKRLALVLADLAARRRRASQIDLRFEGTAVVRPLGR